ncbi:MAG: histone [Chlamydiia bacterium]|nr:histone [Chlamydiia bacterium]
MTLKDSYQKMRELLECIAGDLEKAEAGNKAAAQRVRICTIKFEKVAKLYRKESVEAGKLEKTPAVKKEAIIKKKAASKLKPASKKKVASKSKPASKKKAAFKEKAAKKQATSEKKTTSARKTARRATAKLPKLKAVQKKR